MNCRNELPEHYKLYKKVDLLENKKQMILVNIVSFGLLIVFAVPGMLHRPIWLMYEGVDSVGAILLRGGCLLGGMILYMCAHELTHGIAMKYYGVEKVFYKFHGIYASASCKEYIKKGPYLVIALAPVVVWGIIFGILTLIVDDSWFWIVYMLQLVNVSGAAGDLYVSWLFRKLPEDSYFFDYGVGMEAYVVVE